MRISDWSSDVCSSDLIRDALSAADRKRIDDQVIRPMARFLSDGSPQVINRIHNHATWAAAGVGLSGYLLGDRDLVDKALLGLDKSGKAGFLRQLRSEEHTSELQSLMRISYAVFCLKKKKQT